MNDATQKELKVVVERAVRPVRASTPYKRRMREELLAHLVTIFEEEAEKLGDERAAVDQAKRRFGDPRELTGQLRQSVPRRDRFRRFLEKLSYRPGESLLCFAARHVLTSFMLYMPMLLVGLLVGLLLVLIRGRLDEVTMVTYIWLVVGILSTGLTLVFNLLEAGTCRALCTGSSHRRLQRVAVYCLMSVPVFPVFVFLWYWTLTGDLTSSYVHFCLICCLALLTPVLLVVTARQDAAEMQHNEEWANLQIDQ